MEPGNGASTLLLKSAANSNFTSTLTLFNPQVTSVTVQLTARNGELGSHDTWLVSKYVTIPGSGLFTSNNLLLFLGASFRYGPVVIETLSGNQVIGVSRVVSATDPTSGFFQTVTLDGRRAE